MENNNEGIVVPESGTVDPEKSGINPEEETVEKAEEKKILVSIIYPYKPTADDGYSLRHSIRSLEKHLMLDTPYDFTPEVLVVGPEKPTWLKEENFVKLPAEHQDDFSCISACLMSEKIAEKFILMRDNMFVINDIILADIEVLKANGLLPESDETAMLLRKNNNPIYDYDTQLPCMMSTGVVKQVDEELADIKEFVPSKISLRSIYFNTIFNKIIPIILNWKEDSWVLPVANPIPNPDLVNSQLKHTKFMFFRNTAYSETNNAMIGKMFDVASQFEIECGAE